jgi:hypothetical protein
MVVLTRLHLFTLEQVAGRGRRDARLAESRRHIRSGHRCARRQDHRGRYPHQPDDGLQSTRPGDPYRPPGIGQFAVIQAMGPQHAVELTPIDAHNPVESQTKRIAAFAAAPNGGLIVTVGGTAVHRDVVITAAAKSRLPAIYPYRYFAAGGGLSSVMNSRRLN